MHLRSTLLAMLLLATTVGDQMGNTVFMVRSQVGDLWLATPWK